MPGRTLAVLFACLLAVAACTPATGTTPSSSPVAVASRTPVPTPSPTPRPPAYWPLTGVLARDPAQVDQRPLLVRIGNDTAARPQSGLSKADMVWEMLTEGGITRFMVVFHSQDAGSIGPVRSARLSDLHYAPMLRGALVHVGASNIVLGRIRAVAASGAFVDIDEIANAAAFQRITTRVPPENVYTSTLVLRDAVAKIDASTVKVPIMVPSVRTGANIETSTPARTLTVPYLGAMRVTYAYGDDVQGYRRAQAGVPTLDAVNRQEIVATNVVIIYTDLTPQPGIVEDSNGALSLEIRSTGTGPVTIFTGGARYDGTWSRQGDDAYKFFDQAGAPISLQPGGQTWVHVVPTDWVVTSAP